MDPFSLIPKRFASTKLDGPQFIDPSTTTDAAPPSDFVSDLDLTSSSLDGITTESLTQGIDEHFGFLKQLGLDFGWGPTAVYETILESVHLATGTPWWGSIMLTALLLRVAFLPLVIRAADTAARVATLKPLTEPINERMKEAKATRDMEALNVATQELRQLYQRGNIKIIRMFFPALGQGLIGYGSFRLLRNMASLPVPGLDEGGLLWLNDLTVGDPFFVLPMITGLGIHLTFKVCNSIWRHHHYDLHLYRQEVRLEQG